MTTYRVVLVEDDPMVLSINRRYLEKDSRFEVCAAFGTDGAHWNIWKTTRQTCCCWIFTCRYSPGWTF